MTAPDAATTGVDRTTIRTGDKRRFGVEPLCDSMCDVFMCTETAGHEAGDVPHVACTFLGEVVAVWDNAGRAVIRGRDGNGVSL